MIKKIGITLLASFSAAISANEYQTFINTDYTTIEYGSENTDFLGFSAQHFFDTKDTLGPLNEYEYINTVSNILGSTAHNLDNSDNISTLSGEWISSNVIIGATKQRFGSGSYYNSVRLGYLFSNNFKLEVASSGIDNDYDQTTLMSSYNHQVNANDYIGVTLSSVSYTHLTLPTICSV